MRFPTFHHTPADKLIVTPLIDVIMVLIIFYLIVGQLAVKDHGPLRLPATATGVNETGSGDPIILSVGADGIITLEGTPVDNVSLLKDALLAVNAKDRSVQLRADKDLEYKAVAPVVEACRSAGVASLKLVTTRGGGAAR